MNLDEIPQGSRVFIDANIITAGSNFDQIHGIVVYKPEDISPANP